MVKLSVITLTYNKLEYTKKYIESLFKYTKDFELIIVDNGSTDGTREYLQTIPEVKLILNDENLGFSKGNNQGIDIAQGEYIGFLNNDILLYPNWFEECEKVFLSENTGFVSPRQILLRHEKCNEKNYINYFKKKHYIKPYEKTFEECVFSCVITKRDVIQNIGKFDENYTPAFFEDEDCKIRAIFGGYDIYVSNSCCFFHFGSVTSKKLNTNFEKNKQYYYSKFPIAEYIALTGQEKYTLQRQIKHFNVFPLNMIYAVCLFFIKGTNRIKKIIGIYRK